MEIQKATTHSHLQLRMKLGYIKDLQCLIVEPTLLHGISPREGKMHSKLQLYLHTNRQTVIGDDASIQRSPVYQDVKESIAFDLLDGRQGLYQFQLDPEADTFLTVTIFDINRANWKHFVGEAIVQVSTLLVL